MAFVESVIPNTSRSFILIASFAISILSSLDICTDMVDRYCDPRSDICAVERGIKTALSVLLMLVHFSLSTHTTLKSILPILIVLPIGSSVQKRLVTTVGPRTATLSRLVFAPSVIKIPREIVALFTVSYTGKTQFTVTLVLLLP